MFFEDVGVGTETGFADGAGTAFLLAEDDASDLPGVSVLVEYKNPPKPMAKRHTSVTAMGRIRFGAGNAGSGGGVFDCGVA